MHFFFPGRMAVDDLPFEMRRVAELMKRNGVDSFYSVLLKANPLIKHKDAIFQDRFGSVELLEVPPFRDALTTERPLDDLFVQARLDVRNGIPLSLANHEARMWRTTGSARGPASLERLAAAELNI